MTTISTYTETGEDPMSTLVSPLILVADTFEVSDLTQEIYLTHCFLGVQFLKTDGTTVSDPTAGTLAVKAKTMNSPGVWEDPATSSIDATAPVTIDFSGNIVGVQLIPNAISGDSVIYYRVILTRNAT